MLRVRRYAVLLLLVGSVALCACSGGSAHPKASGPPPLTLGFVNMEGAPAGSFPEARAGAEAAVAHVNDDLGGVAGHRLALSSCRTDGTPEASQSCAQRFLAAKPLAVVSGVDLGANASVGPITAAGIPYVTGSPTLGAELTTKGVFAFTAGTAGDLLGIGQYLIETKHVKSIHVLHEDLPGLLNTAIDAAGNIFRAKHVTDVKLVAEKADAADFGPALTAAAAGHPDAVIVVFPAQACARIMQSAQALAVRADLYYPGACASPAVVAGRDSGLDHSYFASGYLPVGASGGDAAAADFRKRVPAAQRSPLSEASYAAVLDVARLIGEGKTDPASLKAALAASVGAPSPLSHPFTCDGKQLPLLTTVCNSNVRLLQYRSGAFVDVLGSWINGGQLTALAG